MQLADTIPLSAEAGKIGQVRTCVGCRARDSRAQLLRVVARDTAIVPDVSAAAAGRGAWVHDSVQCLTQAITRRAFSRALRVPADVDTTQIENRLKLIMDHS